MGLEFICDRCKSPMCAFRHHVKVNLSREVVQERICVHCAHIERQAGPDVPEFVYRAIGVLTAQHRGYIMDSWRRLMLNSCETGIRHKAQALIKHDRILRAGQPAGEGV